MFDYLSPTEKTCAVINGVVTLFIWPVGLILILIAFLIGLFRGDYQYAKGFGFGFLIVFVVTFVIGLIFGLTLGTFAWLEDINQTAS